MNSKYFSKPLNLSQFKYPSSTTKNVILKYSNHYDDYNNKVCYIYTQNLNLLSMFTYIVFDDELSGHSYKNEEIFNILSIDSDCFVIRGHVQFKPTQNMVWRIVSSLTLVYGLFKLKLKKIQNELLSLDENSTEHYILEEQVKEIDNIMLHIKEDNQVKQYLNQEKEKEKEKESYTKHEIKNKTTIPVVIAEAVEVKKYSKKNIPKQVKTEVWNTHIGDDIMKHKCLCCKKVTIKNTDFVVGHVISEANGGNLNISNLRPICSSCNYSMGTINMEEYVKTYGYYI
jgi:5-methylcytosine-specific restriction endonuclease McrA